MEWSREILQKVKNGSTMSYGNQHLTMSIEEKVSTHQQDRCHAMHATIIVKTERYRINFGPVSYVKASKEFESRLVIDGDWKG